METSPDLLEGISIEVKQFQYKHQIKVFLKMFDSKKEGAKILFEKLYKSSELQIYDETGAVKYHRKMRAYLVKDEGTMESLAKAKFYDDLKKR